ncbi:MAG: hypothetical protein H9Q66_04730 [Spiroplasma ixodetis]|nr:hypothetical protein [Spiroplasma ixodetis]
MRNLKKIKLTKNNNRFGGKTKKWKNNKGEWEYKTEIRNKSNELDSLIYESYMTIYDKNKNDFKYWTKRTAFPNSQIIFEIFLIKNNKLYKHVKKYENIDKLSDDLKNNKLLDSSPIKVKGGEKSNLKYYYYLENVAINSINNIDMFIKNITSFNQELSININYDNLLKLYQYLTYMQKLIDIPTSSSNISISAKIKKTLPNLLLGLLLVYIAFTGKNAQRIISTYIFDEQEYTSEDYLYGIFQNKQNYFTTFIDTILTTFFTSAIADWSRNTILNIIQSQKSNSINDFKIKKIPIEPFKKYKHEFLTLLYEENEVKLKNNMTRIKHINNLIKKLNNLPKPTDFEYHPNFKKEVEKISDFNCLKKPIDNTIIKELTSSANKVIDNLNKLKKSNLDTLEWKERINYSLFDLFLESITWLMANSIMTGAIANAIQENFKISDWIKYFTKPNIILANTITYFSIRPVNSIFKWGLETLKIKTNICPQIISNWITKQSNYGKFSMAIFLFFLNAVFTNITKTATTLLTKYEVTKSHVLLELKLKKWETWLFFFLATGSQMFSLSISNFYKIFNFETLIKKIRYFHKPNISLLEEKLIELENNSNIPIFNKSKVIKIQDSINEANKTYKVIYSNTKKLIQS